MSLNQIVRFLFAAIFAFLGYLFATLFLDISQPMLEFAVILISVSFFGAFSLFLLPVITASVRSWSASFARRVASEVSSQLRIPRINRTGRRKRVEKNSYENPIVVDTSALIDGRIADLVESGFLYGTLIVPKFVLSELHHIADAPDALRRGKGRRGLEVLDILKKSKWVKTTIYNGKIEQEKEIDNKLLILAKNTKAKILTTDFNLNKVAAVNDIKTLNINELVNALKTTLLPGEPLLVKVIQEGKEKNQGVGYLPDGTMIVVESGATYKGKTIPTTVLRVLQTAAGRMIFVQIAEAERNQTVAEKAVG